MGSAAPGPAAGATGGLPPGGPPPGAESAEGRPRGPIFAAVAVVVVLIVGGLAAWQLTRSEAPAPTTTTTTSTSSSTTSEPVDLAGEVEVATAKADVSRVLVRSSPPDGWDDMPVRLTMDPPPPEPPSSAATATDKVAIPTVGDPVVGRVATEDGWVFDNPGPFTPRQPFTMVVTERRGDWAKVQIPVRPNGTEGWVDVSQVDLSTNPYRVEVHLSDKELKAYNGAEEITSTKVVIGVEYTPTPTGAFYITDIVPQTSPNFAPFALATNAYSETLDEFDTGVPVIALHGTASPEYIGTARSNGCIRIPNEIVQKLAETLPLGTPVYIWP